MFSQSTDTELFTQVDVECKQDKSCVQCLQTQLQNTKQDCDSSQKHKLVNWSYELDRVGTQ